MKIECMTSCCYCSCSRLKYIHPSASTVGVVPGEPSDVVVTEATKSYVVLAWKPPIQRGHEGVMYYIEKVRRKEAQIQYFYIKKTPITCNKTQQVK